MSGRGQVQRARAAAAGDPTSDLQAAWRSGGLRSIAAQLIARMTRGRRRAAVVAASFVAAVFAATAFGVAPAAAEPMPVGVPGSWGMKFDEEFNSSGLNTSVWTPGWQTNGVSEMNGRCVSPANVSQPGGEGYLRFHLASQLNTCGGKNAYANTGALVESNPGDGVPGHTGFSYKYGYVEWRVFVPGIGAQGCPKGGCIPDWPALWSVPAGQGTNHVSEVDTMEGLSGYPCFHVHPPYPAGNGECAPGSWAGWHTYGADWEPGSITFYYDGHPVGSEAYSYTSPEYLIMNFVTRPPEQVPDEMLVDYVRVWQHPVDTRPAIVDDSATRNQWIYDVGADGQSSIWSWSQSTGTWSNSHMSGEGPMSSPTAVRDPTSGNQWVYYAGADGQIWTWSWNQSTSTWSNAHLGPSGEASSNKIPTAILSPSTGNQWVYYVGADGQIWTWSWNQSTNTWSNSRLGSSGEGAMNSPTAVLDPNSGNQWIYYVGADGQIWTWSWNQSTGTWLNAAPGAGEATNGASPTVTRSPSTGNQWVYYVGADGQIWTWSWNQSTSTWSNARLGASGEGAIADATSTLDPSTGNQWVYYVGANSQIWTWSWNQSTSTWSNSGLGTAGEGATSSPTAIRDPSTGNQWIYYLGNDARMWTWSWTPSGWSNGAL